MEPLLSEKLARLQALLRSYQKIAVAFSGGVDSTLLVKVAQEALGGNALAVTVESPTMPPQDLADVRDFFTQNRITHTIIPLDQLETPSFRHNSSMRCYVCKSIEFTAIARAAKAYGITTLAAGINADDPSDYRPGLKALAEIGVVRPLQDAGLTKADIRALAKHYGLKSWDKPASSCLASRIPYGEQITREKLQRISAGEQVLRRLGLKNLRVRCHRGNIARIEVSPDERSLFFNTRIMDEIADAFHKIGFSYTALDLSGYRSGSLNETLDDETINKVKMSINGSR